MTKYEDECVGCTDLGLHCMGNCCPNRNVRRTYCDKCEEETDDSELYDMDYCEVCKDCLEKYFPEEYAEIFPPDEE